MNYKQIIQNHYINILEKDLANKIIKIHSNKNSTKQELEALKRKFISNFVSEFNESMKKCEINVELRSLDIEQEKITSIISDVKKLKDTLAQINSLTDLECKQQDINLFSSIEETQHYTKDINDFMENLNNFKLGTQEYGECIAKFAETYKGKIYFRSHEEQNLILRIEESDRTKQQKALLGYDRAAQKLEKIIKQAKELTPEQNVKPSLSKIIKPIDLDTIENFLESYKKLVQSIEEIFDQRPNSDLKSEPNIEFNANLKSKEIIVKSSKLMKAAAGFLEGMQYVGTQYLRLSVILLQSGSGAVGPPLLIITAIMPIVFLIGGIWGVIDVLTLDSKKEQVDKLGLTDKLEGFRKASEVLTQAVGSMKIKPQKA